MAVSWSTIVAKAKRSIKNLDTADETSRPVRSSLRWGRTRHEEEDDQPPADDPHELVSRFIWTHQQHFDEALAELKRGHKCSCWMWYIFPTPPWVVNGQERGSWTNTRYALRTDEQARGYLTFTHSEVNLRKNYYEATEAVVYHLEKGKSARQIVGIADEPKLQSSWEYFEKITRDEPDQALHNLIAKGLALIKDPPFKTATKAKKTKYGRSIFAASSSDEETGSSSSAPSTTTARDEISEISVSELSNEINRSASELSTAEMQDQNKVELLEGKSLNEEHELSELSPMATCEVVNPDEIEETVPENKPTISPKRTGATSNFPIYCEVVDCFNCVPCSEHSSRAEL